MNKRGMEQQVFLFGELMIGLLVGGILLLGASNVDFFSEVNKNYAQRDISLLAETIDASPGELTYEYELKAAFEVDLGDEVSVQKSANVLETYQAEIIEFEKSPSSREIKVKYE